MLIPKAKTPNRPADLDWAVPGIVLLVGGGCLLLWLGGQAASMLSGIGLAAGPVAAGARALLADRDHPGAAWDSAMPDAPAYWWITAISIAALVALTVAAVVKVRGRTRGGCLVAEMESRPGMATARAIRTAVGPKRLRRSAPELRPTLAGRIAPRELG